MLHAMCTSSHVSALSHVTMCLDYEVSGVVYLVELTVGLLHLPVRECSGKPVS